MRLLLASSSPRRRELLSLLVSDFESSAPDIDESPRTAESPADYVARLAREKAKAGAADQWVSLGSDTTVAMGQEILGKPRDRQDAAAMLRALSGNTHEVHTAVATAYGDSIETVTCTTRGSSARAKSSISRSSAMRRATEIPSAGSIAG